MFFLRLRLAGRAATAATALVSLLSFSPAAAAPLPIEGRIVPARVDGVTLVADGQAPKTIVASGSHIEFAVRLDPAAAARVYCLFVPLTTAAKVVVNDRRLDVRPVVRRDGLAFRINEMYLREGPNTLSVDRTDLGESAPWDGLALFALDGTGEEVHFNRTFSDNEPSRNAQPAPDPLQAQYDVQWYDCSWTVSMSDSILEAATVWMGAKSLNSTLATAVLDFDNNGGQLAIDSVDGGPGTPSLPYTVGSGRLRVTLPAPVPAGNEFRARVTYHGRPNPSNIFSPPYLLDTHGASNTPVLFTFSEPYGARQWWPCKDLPDDKAVTTTQRISVPATGNWKVVSNGKLESVTDAGSKKVWTWVNSHPISTYLLSVCVSDYLAVSSTYVSRDGLTTMPISHYIFPENSPTEGNAAVGTLAVMNFFADTFGEYPFLNEKYWTASHTDGAGMEHQTCTSMPGGDVQDGRQRRNVHELSHHWYGDKITCRSMDHLWLNEGFATMAEALWVEYTSGVAAYHTYVNSWVTQGVSTSTPLVGSSADSFSGSVVYRKGGWVLHMLRHVVGDAKFFAILRTWAASPAFSYGTAVSADFQAVAESVSGQNLSQFFSQWLYRPNGGTEPAGQPRYNYSGSAAKSGGTTTLNVQIVQSQSGTPYVMPIDIEMIDATGTHQTTSVLNSVASQSANLSTGAFSPVEINFDPDNWIFKAMRFSVNTVALPDGRVGSSFSRTLRASNGSAPYTWTVTSGKPDGLTLSSAGVLSGTPTTQGNYTLAVTARDNAATTRNVSLPMTVLPSQAGVEDWDRH